MTFSEILNAITGIFAKKTEQPAQEPLLLPTPVPITTGILDPFPNLSRLTVVSPEQYLKDLDSLGLNQKLQFPDIHAIYSSTSSTTITEDRPTEERKYTDAIERAIQKKMDDIIPNYPLRGLLNCESRCKNQREPEPIEQEPKKQKIEAPTLQPSDDTTAEQCPPSPKYKNSYRHMN